MIICKKCMDLGMIYSTEIINNYEYEFGRECECQKLRRANEKQNRYQEKSGLGDVLLNMRFDNYETNNIASQRIKEMAMRNIQGDNANWWYISGNTGTGKTHITTAMCGELITRNKELHYMKWVDEMTTLKTQVMSDSEEYNNKLYRLKNVAVLYIDDFLKGGYTEADLKTAFNIINHRYMARKKTLISSEYSMQQLREIDSALAGRINEYAIGYVIHLGKEMDRRFA